MLIMQIFSQLTLILGKLEINNFLHLAVLLEVVDLMYTINFFGSYSFQKQIFLLNTFTIA